MSLLLIDHNANVNLRNIYGYSPLSLAVLRGNIAVVNAILESGCEFDSFYEAFENG